MQITVEEALQLLRLQGERVARARALVDEAEDARDALIRELDGQPGMVRREMAEALGMTKTRLFQIAGNAKPEREALVDGVPMDQELFDALVDVVGQFARTQKDAEAVRLDVHA
jgi:hypothetical protein